MEKQAKPPRITATCCSVTLSLQLLWGSVHHMKMKCVWTGAKPIQQAAVHPVEVVCLVGVLLNTISFGHSGIRTTHDGAGHATHRVMHRSALHLWERTMCQL